MEAIKGLRARLEALKTKIQREAAENCAALDGLLEQAGEVVREITPSTGGGPGEEV